MICSDGIQKKGVRPHVAVSWGVTSSSICLKKNVYLAEIKDSADDGAEKTAEVNQAAAASLSKMKKIINIFAIVFFLSPVFAMADSFSWTASSGAVGSNPTFSASITAGNACTIFDLSGNRQGTYEGSNCGTAFTDLATYVADWSGALLSDWNGITGTIHAGVISPYNGVSGPLCDTYTNCVASGFFSSDDTFTFSDSPPPPPPDTSIDAAVAVATSSFATTFGFDMDQVSVWMWDNLGQPILGSGIGVLYVMRYYWLGFIAITIIVFFAFLYFRFFKR